jgi:hypothetical protein
LDNIWKSCERGFLHKHKHGNDGDYSIVVDENGGFVYGEQKLAFTLVATCFGYEERDRVVFPSLETEYTIGRCGHLQPNKFPLVLKQTRGLHKLILRKWLDTTIH